MRRLNHTVVATIGVGALAAVAWGPVPTAVASCVAPQPLRQAVAHAPVVFVGTVIATRNNARTAVVRVDQVWRGPEMKHRVVVKGSPATGSVITSVDRSFQTGVRYLFVPTPVTRTSPYQDNACTPTRPYTPKLAKFRPQSAHRP